MIILLKISTNLLGIVVGSGILLLVILVIISIYQYQKEVVCGTIITIEPPVGNDAYTTIILWEQDDKKSYRVYKSMLENIRVGYYVELYKRKFQSIYCISFAHGET